MDDLSEILITIGIVMAVMYAIYRIPGLKKIIK